MPDGSVMVGDRDLIRRYGDEVVDPNPFDAEFQRLLAKGYYVRRGSLWTSYLLTERGRIALGKKSGPARAKPYGPGSAKQR